MYKLKTIEETILKQYMNKADLTNKLMAKVLFNRKYKAEYIKEMLKNPENFYRDSSKIYGASEAAKKIIKHIVKPRNKIYIFGDYDADGITSTVLLKVFLESFKLNTKFDIRLPERKEGYGLNLEYCKEVIEDGYYSNEDKLVITVDNGITCVKQVELLNSYGIDTVIIDHHMPIKDSIPKAVICDPHMESLSDKEDYEGKNLAGVAVVYKVCQCINSYANANRQINMKDFLPLAAIGTISDIMNLDEENTALVMTGLNELKNPSDNNRFKTLYKTISQHLNSKNILYSMIAWDLAPRLNACGRISTPKTAAKLFFSYKDTQSKIKDILRELDSINNDRKKYSTAAKMEIEKKYDFSNDLICCCELKTAPEGILGQVAGIVLEKEQKPVFVLKRKENLLVGSGRSPFDITDILNEEKGNTVHFFAGHKQAFGIQIYADKINEFKNSLSKKIKERSLKVEDKTIYIDSIINLEDITINNFYEINKFPLMSNNEPIFMIENLNILECRPSKSNPDNILFMFSNRRIISKIWGWKIGKKLDKLKSLNEVCIICKLDLDFMNPNKATVTIIDMFNRK